MWNVIMFQLNASSFHTVNWRLKAFDPIVPYMFWCLMNILSFSCYVSYLLLMQALLVLRLKTAAFLPPIFLPDF